MGPIHKPKKRKKTAHSLTDFMNEKSTQIWTLDLLTVHLSLKDRCVCMCVCVSGTKRGHGLMSLWLLFQSAILKTK